MIMETERLIVRNFIAKDWKDLHEYLSQKEVLRLMGAKDLRRYMKLF